MSSVVLSDKALCLALFCIAFFDVSLPSAKPSVTGARRNANRAAVDARRTSAWTPIPTTGDQPLLVVLCDFSDEVGRFPGVEWRDHFFGEGGFADYFLQNSYDKLRYQGVVVGLESGIGAPVEDSSSPYNDYLRLPENISFYANSASGFNVQPCQRSSHAGIVHDALVLLESRGFDFGPYANPSTRMVDNIIFVAASKDSRKTGDNKVSLLPTSFELRLAFGSGCQTTLNMNSQNYFQSAGGYMVNAYTFCTARTEKDDKPASLGPCLHEHGHSLGLQTWYGTGQYSLMGNGLWGPDGSGEYPAHFSSWDKMMLGWLEPRLASPADHEVIYHLLPSHNSSDCLRLTLNFSNEYYIIENRQELAFGNPHSLGSAQKFCPGILIWHIDGDIAQPGSKYWRANTVNGLSAFWNVRIPPPHNGITVKEADRDSSLQATSEDGYDYECNDTYRIGPTFDGEHARLWSGAPSGVKVRVLSNPNSLAEGRVRIGVTCPSCIGPRMPEAKYEDASITRGSMVTLISDEAVFKLALESTSIYWDDSMRFLFGYTVFVEQDASGGYVQVEALTPRSARSMKYRIPTTLIEWLQAPCSNPHAQSGYAISGTSEIRTRYKYPSDPSCKQENQFRNCTNGSWSEWSGTYTYLDCYEEASCVNPDTISRGAQNRQMYEKARVRLPANCKRERQERECYNGSWGAWSGTYTHSACQLQAAGHALHMTLRLVMLQNRNFNAGKLREELAKATGMNVSQIEIRAVKFFVVANYTFSADVPLADAQFAIADAYSVPVDHVTVTAADLGDPAQISPAASKGVSWDVSMFAGVKEEDADNLIVQASNTNALSESLKADDISTTTTLREPARKAIVMETTTTVDQGAPLARPSKAAIEQLAKSLGSTLFIDDAVIDWKGNPPPTPAPTTTTTTITTTTTTFTTTTTLSKMALWSQIGESLYTCSKGINYSVVAEQHDCQQKAIDDNHPFYQYESVRKACATSETCDSPVKAEEDWKWNIYRQATTPAPPTAPPADAGYELAGFGVYCGTADYANSTLSASECKKWCDRKARCRAFVTYTDCDDQFSCLAYTTHDCSAAHHKATSCPTSEAVVAAYNKAGFVEPQDTNMAANSLVLLASLLCASIVVMPVI